MNYEERINDLEERLQKLEKVEKRRKIKNIIVFSFYTAIVISIIAVMVFLYYKIKPYKQKIDSLTSWSSKTDTVIDGGDDYWDYFNGLFN